MYFCVETRLSRHQKSHTMGLISKAVQHLWVQRTQGTPLTTSFPGEQSEYPGNEVALLIDHKRN